MLDIDLTDAFALTAGWGWQIVAGAILAAILLPRLWRWAITLPGFAPTPAVSRVLSHLVGSRDLSEEEFLRADGASERWVEPRRQALEALRRELASHSPDSARFGDRLRDGMSDLRFADANRVPFPFARLMRERFNVASVGVRTEGPYLYDLDGNAALDVSGSYGVNVVGYDRYKQWLDAGWQRVRDLGPVLGPVHPVVAENIDSLKAISGQEEVSFHCSGTEAVMAAVRLARFNTRRQKIVCFSGAYHGWWDGVQPGIGSERSIGDVLTLSEMKRGALDVIRHRAGEIAAVLVNPVQSFHPNSPPPNDAVLLASEARRTQDVGGGYRQWLEALREVCTASGVPLIFDEVYSGFRLAPGGAQEYFGVKADMVVYGKTLAAGLPIGVVCGSRALMRRFDPDHPMRIAYVVGTFSAYPQAMGAMREFLEWVTSAEARAEYTASLAACEQWVADTNRDLAAEALPLKVVNLGSIWTVTFTRPSRFNWLLQYYLRVQGLNMSWVGTGRCLFSMDFQQQQFDELRLMILEAARRMRTDRWWLSETEEPDQDKRIRSRLIKEMVASVIRLPRPIAAFYTEVMRRKHDDHVASHSHPTNQFLHLVSSSVFLVCYVLLFVNLPLAVWMGVVSLFLRQAGHALIEPPCHDKEQLLLGFDTRSKTFIVAGYALIPLGNWLWAAEGSAAMDVAATVGLQWFAFTGLVILGRVLLLVRRHGFNNSMVWFIKLVTDPITDIKAYYRSVLRPFGEVERSA
ncbi:MAG: aminotransferase class III-fold pyridoxal phosphate-dependent enzyme [Pseudomonadales bacterium]